MNTTMRRDWFSTAFFAVLAVGLFGCAVGAAAGSWGVAVPVLCCLAACCVKVAHSCTEED